MASTTSDVESSSDDVMMIPGSEEWNEYWRKEGEKWAAQSSGMEEVKESVKEKDAIDDDEEDKHPVDRKLPWPYAPAWESEPGDYFPAPNLWSGIIDGLKERAARGDEEAIKELDELEARKKKGREERVDNSWPPCEESDTRERKVIGVCSMKESFDRGDFRERQFNMWMYAPMYENPHGFPCYSFHLDLLRLKNVLWRRYGTDYDVMTIREVFPDNELAEWVIEARVAGRRPWVKFRDTEMSYERSRSFGEYSWPKWMRSYEDECRVQARRRHYREKTVEWEHPEEWFRVPEMKKTIYEGEELPEVILAARRKKVEENEAYWERRRNPSKEQHEAQEPDFDRWDALQARKRKLEEEKLKVSI